MDFILIVCKSNNLSLKWALKAIFFVSLQNERTENKGKTKERQRKKEKKEKQKITNKKNKQDNANIYTSTINTLIDNNELEKIDFSTLSRKNIYSIMHALSDQYNYYATSSHNYSSAKSKGNNYISNPNVTEQELNNNIDLMKTRFEKIENILDPL